MTSKELDKAIQNNTDLLLIDVREQFELEISRMKLAEHIPMGIIPQLMNKLPTNKDLIIMCHHGIRSSQVVQFLKSNGFERVFNLEGGIHSWAVEVDLNMVRY